MCDKCKVKMKKFYIETAQKTQLLNFYFVKLLTKQKTQYIFVEI